MCEGCVKVALTEATAGYEIVMMKANVERVIEGDMNAREAQTLAARLDRIPFSRFHIRLLAMGGCGYVFDAMDVAIIAFVLPVLRVQWHLRPGQMGLVGAAAAIGGFAGAFGAGVLGDAIGRRRVMMWALALYCIATFASAFAADWSHFLFWRVIAGVGTSAESAIVAPFLVEFAGPSFRGRYIGALASFFSVGFLAAATLGYFVVPLQSEAWRTALVVTALPVVMLLWWRRSLPESPRWLASKGRIREANDVVARIERASGCEWGGSGMPFQDRPSINRSSAEISTYPVGLYSLFSRSLVRVTFMSLLLWFSLGFAYYAFFTWIPSLLVDKELSVTSSYRYALIMYAAQIPGYLSAAALNDRIGRRAVIVSYLLLGASSAMWLALASSNVAELWAGSCMSFFMNGAYAGVYTYTPELFPTEVRATAHGTALSISRIAAAISPLAVAYVAPLYGFFGVFAMSSSVLLAGGIAVLVLGVKTGKRSLEQIVEPH